MWLHALLMRVTAWLSPEQLRVATFLLVGGIGIGSNLAGMLLFRGLGDGPASVAGAIVGVLSNFVLHCRLTFRDRLKLRGHRSLASWLHLFAEFCLSSTVAVVAQLLAARSIRALGVQAAVAQFGGILSGTLINFVAQNWCIFRAPPGSRERTFDSEEAYAV
tara:strand:+ start:222 stop:707 length:486 start_codon:yes stop_codon:yes gene_type:complete